jgi:tetratricopeptide (TPR) repeat protein
MKLKLCFLLILLFPTIQQACAAEYTFDYNKNCHLAYQQYMALHPDEGNAFIRQEIKDHPYNLMATYVADYDDCLLLLFNGDKKDYDQRKGHMDDRIDLLSQGNKKDPWYRFCKAGIYLHWALVQVRFGENYRAAMTFRKSFQLIKENNRLFPGFPQNKIFLGMEETVVGTVPDEYKWLSALFGMKGNVKQGIAKLSAFMNAGNGSEPFRNEAVIFYCYLKFYLLSQQDEVWSFLNSSQFSTNNNLLHAFVKGNIALNFRKGEAAIQILKAAQTDPYYIRYPSFDYELGTAMLHKLDNSSISYLTSFLNRGKGSFYVKDAWQKMAQAYYLQRNFTKANFCRQQISKKGSTQVDADKQAQRFAESKDWPDMMLLQTRLLSDGGYYNQALTMLTAVDVNKYSAVADKLEYYFRLARVYDELGKDAKAIQYYQITLNMGRDRQEHFAARSSLQMGFIYERSGKIADAVARYRACLDMRHHDFQSSIDQQAKAGIDRLTQK